MKHVAKSIDTFTSYSKCAATIAHLARHQYQAASFTSRQYQQAAPAGSRQQHQFSSARPSCISKQWTTYLCFHSETDSSNNCGYVVLNQRLRLRQGVKDSLKNSLVRSPQNLDLGRHNRSSLVQRCQRGFIVKDKEREYSECKNIVVISLLAHAQECETTSRTKVSNDDHK